MAKELRSIDVSKVPELLRIAEEVRDSGEPRVLTRNSEELAIVTPAKRVKKRPTKGSPFTMDDPLWNLAGIGRSEGPTDVSENKHKYLAETYADTHE